MENLRLPDQVGLGAWQLKLKMGNEGFWQNSRVPGADQ